jgi:hypothetical protein
MFAGMVRDISGGAAIHFDEINQEFPGGADDTPVAQLAYNAYLQMPEAGGELEVIRRRWQPEDEARRGPYFYPEEIVAGHPRATVLAEVGDVILFDPRQFHRIRPGRGSGRRITFSFFVGLSGAGELLVWS